MWGCRHRYTGPAARQSVLERQAIWRSEMARELSLDPPAYGASHRFALAAPLKPSHTFGDAPSRAVRLDYVKTMNSLRVTLGEQAAHGTAWHSMEHDTARIAYHSI